MNLDTLRNNKTLIIKVSAVATVIFSAYLIFQATPQQQKAANFEKHRNVILNEASHVIDTYSPRYAQKYLNLIPSKAKDEEVKQIRETLSLLDRVYTLSISQQFASEVKYAKESNKAGMPSLCMYSNHLRDLLTARPLHEVVLKDYERAVKWCDVKGSDTNKTLSETYKSIAKTHGGEIKGIYEQMAKDRHEIYIDDLAFETRQRNIKRMFNQWGGSVDSVMAHVKSTMKHPESFEHLGTTYRDEGDHIAVTMKYKGFEGQNAFKDEVTVKVDINGQVISSDNATIRASVDVLEKCDLNLLVPRLNQLIDKALNHEFPQLKTVFMLDNDHMVNARSRKGVRVIHEKGTWHFPVRAGSYLYLEKSAYGAAYELPELAYEETCLAEELA